MEAIVVTSSQSVALFSLAIHPHPLFLLCKRAHGRLRGRQEAFPQLPSPKVCQGLTCKPFLPSFLPSPAPPTSESSFEQIAHLSGCRRRQRVMNATKLASAAGGITNWRLHTVAFLTVIVVHCHGGGVGIGDGEEHRQNGDDRVVVDHPSPPPHLALATPCFLSSLLVRAIYGRFLRFGSPSITRDLNCKSSAGRTPPLLPSLRLGGRQPVGRDRRGEWDTLSLFRSLSLSTGVLPACLSVSRCMSTFSLGSSRSPLARVEFNFE